VTEAVRSVSERPEDRRWSNYWAQGHVHSLGRAYDGGNYSGSIRDFWQRVFDTLPEGARVLDICSGNGAVALLAVDYSSEHQRGLVVDAVDRAEIDPEQALGPEVAAAIRFQGGVAVESLPFEADSFDLVTAQYGLEYTDAHTSVPELARVLRPGGQLAVIHHHPDSHVIRTARAERSLIDGLLVADGVLPAVESLLNRLLRMETRHGMGKPGVTALREDAQAEGARQQLNQAVAGLERLGRERPGAAPLLAEILGRLRALLGQMGRQPAEQLCRELQSLHQDYQGNAERLGDLLGCRMAADEYDLSPQLTAAGFECRDAGRLQEMVEQQPLLLGGYWWGSIEGAFCRGVEGSR